METTSSIGGFHFLGYVRWKPDKSKWRGKSQDHVYIQSPIFIHPVTRGLLSVSSILTKTVGEIYNLY